MNETKTLDQVKISEKVKIETINTEDTIKRRLLDMGMIELRKDDSKNIIVKNI